MGMSSPVSFVCVRACSRLWVNLSASAGGRGKTSFIHWLEYMHTSSSTQRIRLDAVLNINRGLSALSNPVVRPQYLLKVVGFF